MEKVTASRRLPTKQEELTYTDKHGTITIRNNYYTILNKNEKCKIRRRNS